MTFQADRERLAELYDQAKSKGIRVKQWNLAASDGDLPETIADMVELMEKTVSGEFDVADRSTLLDDSK